jgi:ElaB/YqjD/DUF883 family membrane-anchored ribosome-binding protein
MEQMEQVDIINKIIEIEQMAQELIKNAKEDQNEISKKIAETLEEKRAKYLEDTDKHIKRITVEETKFADEKIAEIKKEHELKLQELKTIAEKNIPEWIEEAYSYIMKPTDLAK